MRLHHVLSATVLLGLLVGVWLLTSERSRGSGDAFVLPAPGEVATEVAERAPAELVAAGARSDLRAAVEASAGPAGSDAGDLHRTAEAPAEPEPGPAAPPPARQRPHAHPTEVLYVLRVHVRPEGWSGASPSSDATVTFDFGDAAARISGTTPLYRAVELTVVRQAKRPLAGTGLVLVDHPGYPPLIRELDLDRPRSGGRDEEGRTILAYEFTAVLQRSAAVLVGRTHGAEHVVLAEHTATRSPGVLSLADVATASHGEYRLRVPRAGDWMVIALSETAHPSYAIVEVPPTPTARGTARVPQVLTVERRLAPHETALVVQSSHPRGYDPAGIECLLVPYDTSMRELGLDGELVDARALDRAWSAGGFAGGPPYLTWHRTLAEPPSGEPWGYDLRSGQDQPERRDSIARLGTRGALGGDGLARIVGGATGAAVVLVSHPFSAGMWFVDHVGDLAAIDRAPVVLPVARLDVVAVGPTGPLAGGVARVERSHAQEWLASVVLDERGAGPLFVPSSTSLLFDVRGPGGASTTPTPLTTPPPGGTRALHATATTVDPAAESATGRVLPR